MHSIFTGENFIASNLAKQFKPRAKGYTQKIQAKATAYRCLAQDYEDKLEAAQAKLIKWEQWANDYRDAAKDAYNEAERANTDRTLAEQTLHQITHLIQFGDRGAATVLGQIQNLIDDYLDREPKA